MAEYHLTRRAFNASYSNRTAKVKTCKTLSDALIHARKAHGRHGHVSITIKGDNATAVVGAYAGGRVTLDLPEAWADLLIDGLLMSGH